MEGRSPGHGSHSWSHGWKIVSAAEMRATSKRRNHSAVCQVQRPTSECGECGFSHRSTSQQNVQIPQKNRKQEARTRQ
jgi:hypothetical protein